MSKFTTEQLKAALIELYKANELAAHQLAFVERNLLSMRDAIDEAMDMLIDMTGDHED